MFSIPLERDSQTNHILRACDYNELVLAVVGTSLGGVEQFHVYKDLICARSKFFKSACSEAQEKRTHRRIRLTQTRPAVFKRYIIWIYSNDIDVTRSPSTKEGYYVDQCSLIDLYRLGNVLDDLELRKRILRLLVTREEQHKTLSSNECYSIAFCYPKLRGSPLRNLMIDMWIQRADKSLSAVEILGMHHEFRNQLLIAFVQRIGSDPSSQAFQGRVEDYIEAETGWTTEKTVVELAL